MQKKLNKAAIVLLYTLFLIACSNQPSGMPEATDTPTSGEVKVVIDEGYTRLFETQIYTFESLYSNAKVNVTYLSESDALNRMLQDSCKVVVMSRDLSAAERKTFEAGNLFPVSTKVGEDAIALIVNPENADSVLSTENIRQILLGHDSLWSQLSIGSPKERINVVFDSKGSANARYMRDSLLKGKEFSKNVFAVNSNPEVIDYVSTHKGAVGFIGVNWISDLDDPRVKETLRKVKVVYVSNGKDAPVKPEQAHIKLKDYPFTRSIYMINRQTRAGLGMGFVSFVAGEKGQLMMLKSGLIPGFPPERTIKIKY